MNIQNLRTLVYRCKILAQMSDQTNTLEILKGISRKHGISWEMICDPDTEETVRLGAIEVALRHFGGLLEEVPSEVKEAIELQFNQKLELIEAA